MPLRRLLVILLTGFLSLLAHQGADAQTIGIGCKEYMSSHYDLFSFRPGEEFCLANPTTSTDNGIDVVLMYSGMPELSIHEYQMSMRVVSGGQEISSSGYCLGDCSYESSADVVHGFYCFGICDVSLAAMDENGRDIRLNGSVNAAEGLFEAAAIYEAADTTPPDITLEYLGFDAGTDIATFGYTANETVTQGSVNPGVPSGDANFDGIDTNTGTISYKVGSPGTFVAALGDEG